MIAPKRTRSSEMAELMGEIDVQMTTMRRGFDPGEKIAGTVLYRMDELDRWADSRTYFSTADTMSKEVSHGASR